MMRLCTINYAHFNLVVLALFARVSVTVFGCLWRWWFDLCASSTLLDSKFVFQSLEFCLR